MKRTIMSVNVLLDMIYHEASISYIVKGDDQETIIRAKTIFGR